MLLFFPFVFEKRHQLGLEWFSVDWVHCDHYGAALFGFSEAAKLARLVTDVTGALQTPRFFAKVQ